MNTVATKLAKNLCYTFRPFSLKNARIYSRNKEEDEPVAKDHRDELRAAAGRGERELPAGQAEDDKVKRHGVDERRGEDRRVRVGDHAARAGDPGGLEHDAYKPLVSTMRRGRRDAGCIPWRSSDQCPSAMRVRGAAMAQLRPQMAILK